MFLPILFCYSQIDTLFECLSRRYSTFVDNVIYFAAIFIQRALVLIFVVAWISLSVFLTLHILVAMIYDLQHIFHSIITIKWIITFAYKTMFICQSFCWRSCIMSEAVFATLVLTKCSRKLLSNSRKTPAISSADLVTLKTKKVVLSSNLI